MLIVASADHANSADNVLSTPSNRSIYLATSRPHVLAAIEGFHSTLFAYGQTASGKTYTLTGTKEEPGVIQMAIDDIFEAIRRERGREFLLRASYLEIYNENISELENPSFLTFSAKSARWRTKNKPRSLNEDTITEDLLSPGTTSVEIRAPTPSEVVLSPLREEIVTSASHVAEILARGDAARRTAATDWNARSSRSHSVFRLVIESTGVGGGVGRSSVLVCSFRHVPS